MGTSRKGRKVGGQEGKIGGMGRKGRKVGCEGWAEGRVR
jgi:hypothetical protein